ncbi:MAG: sigma 54-interacting transcriptional regulator [Bacteroidetes bacterium]|nr:sigma 54-interacting transcriptional regulator [Bacteroidota bacterium]
MERYLGTIDSELLGMKKAHLLELIEQRKGILKTVNKGTIFLDEIGGNAYWNQARLLIVNRVSL